MPGPALQPTVFLFCRLGDMVMLTPLLNLLHQRYRRPCRVIGTARGRRRSTQAIRTSLRSGHSTATFRLSCRAPGRRCGALYGTLTQVRSMSASPITGSCREYAAC